MYLYGRLFIQKGAQFAQAVFGVLVYDDPVSDGGYTDNDIYLIVPLVDVFFHRTVHANHLCGHDVFRATDSTNRIVYYEQFAFIPAQGQFTQHITPLPIAFIGYRGGHVTGSNRTSATVPVGGLSRA